MATTDDVGGTDTLEVAHGALLVAVDDLRRVRNSVGHAQSYLVQYVYCDSDYGGWFTNACQQVNNVRESLAHNYAYGQDSVFGMLDGAAAAVEGCWHTFRETDAAIADVTMRSVRVRLESTGPFDISDPLGVDGPIETYPVRTPPSMPVVSDTSYDSCFTAPTADPALSGAFEGIGAYREIQGKISYVSGLEFLTKPLGQFGIADPLKRFKAEMDGDYVQLGLAMAALRSLERYWRYVAQDVGLIATKLSHYWRGQAATAAVTWLQRFAAAAGDHADAIGEASDRIFDKAVALKTQMDVFFRLIDDVVGLIPSPSDLLDPVSPLKLSARLMHLVDLVDKAMYLTDIVLVIGSAYCTLIARASHELRFARLPTPTSF